ncbi:hypothetical protein [Peribacillus simplex]|uniref:hypothetical protein n=1 Tax=Peribacillus simplex TaxID=1478 RepID=UPI0024BFD44C|nr:hypothetical protein [Peribacillus simplex]WHY95790.1 hypothetical protein QNH37_17520 [Peribacillus simplex]
MGQVIVVPHFLYSITSVPAYAWVLNLLIIVTFIDVMGMKMVTIAITYGEQGKVTVAVVLKANTIKFLYCFQNFANRYGTVMTVWWKLPYLYKKPRARTTIRES